MQGDPRYDPYPRDCEGRRVPCEGRWLCVIPLTRRRAPRLSPLKRGRRRHFGRFDIALRIPVVGRHGIEPRRDPVISGLGDSRCRHPHRRFDTERQILPRQPEIRSIAHTHNVSHPYDRNRQPPQEISESSPGRGTRNRTSRVRGCCSPGVGRRSISHPGPSPWL
jgi:hypothetical protein